MSVCEKPRTEMGWCGVNKPLQVPSRPWDCVPLRASLRMKLMTAGSLGFPGTSNTASCIHVR